MTGEYFIIKDDCRKRLLKYLQQAVDVIPQTGRIFNILDIGCGTGVPTLWLADNFKGHITAIDADTESIAFLQHKINEQNLPDRINLKVISFSDFICSPHSFDLILAEGFLNVVGFEFGFIKILDNLAAGGYLIIHDEYRDDELKRELMRTCNCEVVNTLFLDETVWWNEYYRILEKEIENHQNLYERFHNDRLEIDWYRNDPTVFRSIYYVVRKNGL